MRRAFSKLFVSRQREGISGQGSRNKGALDGQRQLCQAYQNLWQDKGFDEAWIKECFQRVRVLVIGKTGAGKTTLIRLMIGKEGPQNICRNVPGEQDINKEFVFSLEDNGIPLVIHDSNGIDVQGKDRMLDVKTFLETHQNADDFTNRVHVVWYVVRAIDNRCADEAGLMRLIGKFKIPLLLISTHNDYGKVALDDASLNILLEGYGTAEERDAVKKLMVKVSNDGVGFGPNKELIVDETKIDRKALKLVAERTQKLMDKRLRYTWVAGQAVDTDAKLKESARSIAGYARTAMLTSLPRAVVLADPIRLSCISFRAFVILCRIWAVPNTLREAMKDTLLVKAGGTRIMQRVGEDMVYLAVSLTTIVATVASAGVAFPLMIAAMVASGIFNIGKSSSVMVKTFSLQVLATILYAKSTLLNSRHRWNPAVTKQEYVQLCEDFAHNVRYQQMLQKFAEEHHSRLDTALRKTKVKGIIKSKALEIYSSLLRDRPNSLSSLFELGDSSSWDDSDHRSPESSFALEVDEEDDTRDELSDTEGF